MVILSQCNAMQLLLKNSAEKCQWSDALLKPNLTLCVFGPCLAVTGQIWLTNQFSSPGLNLSVRLQLCPDYRIQFWTYLKNGFHIPDSCIRCCKTANCCLDLRAAACAGLTKHLNRKRNYRWGSRAFPLYGRLTCSQEVIRGDERSNNACVSFHGWWRRENTHRTHKIALLEQIITKRKVAVTIVWRLKNPSPI